MRVRVCDCDCARGCRHVCHIFKLRLLCLKTKKHYLGMCDIVGKCARTDVCLHMNAGNVFFLWERAVFLLLLFFLLDVCVYVHMHHVNFFLNKFNPSMFPKTAQKMANFDIPTLKQP